MSRASRALRLLPAVLAVWCLSCDAFEAIAESFLEEPPRASFAAASVSTAGDDLRAAATVAVATAVESIDACHCVLGHAAVVLAASTVDRSPTAIADFVDPLAALVLPAPEPLLRPPVA